MTTADKLAAFCGQEDGRLVVTSPWLSDGYTYATNQYVIVRVKGEHAQPDKPDTNRPPQLKRWDDFGRAEFRELVSLPEARCSTCDGFGKVGICLECDGTGTASFLGEYSGRDYEFECLNCGGDGEVDSGVYRPCNDCLGVGRIHDGGEKVTILGKRFQAKLIILAQTLGGVEYAAGSNGWLLLRAGEFEGIIVPLSDEGKK